MQTFKTNVGIELKSYISDKFAKDLETSTNASRFLVQHGTNGTFR